MTASDQSFYRAQLQYDNQRPHDVDDESETPEEREARREEAAETDYL